MTTRDKPPPPALTGLPEGQVLFPGGAETGPSGRAELGCSGVGSVSSEDVVFHPRLLPAVSRRSLSPEGGPADSASPLPQAVSYLCSRLGFQPSGTRSKEGSRYPISQPSCHRFLAARSPPRLPLWLMGWVPVAGGELSFPKLRHYLALRLQSEMGVQVLQD